MPRGVPRTEKERRERHKRLHPDEPMPEKRLGRGYGKGDGRGYGRGRYRQRARDDHAEED